MGTCARCDRPARRLHPVPAEVISRDLIDAYGDHDSPTDLDVCAECTRELLRGDVVV